MCNEMRRILRFEEQESQLSQTNRASAGAVDFF